VFRQLPARERTATQGTGQVGIHDRSLLARTQSHHVEPLVRF
jgi:hypothetical protein